VKRHFDTQSLLWWLDADARLGQPAQEAIAEAAFVAVSAASAWEISIKQAIGELRGPDDLAAELAAHHADPFDRMLVAQARLEGLTLVTRDDRLADYGIARLRA
jgi:PIN domain nuclease of toxin-antitoxin system